MAAGKSAWSMACGFQAMVLWDLIGLGEGAQGHPTRMLSWVDGGSEAKMLSLIPLPLCATSTWSPHSLAGVPRASGLPVKSYETENPAA